MIPWRDLSPDKVERAVKLLLKHLYPDLQAIDGSGGDDGIDALHVNDGGLEIFEIKSFTDRRLSNAQKRQIKRSLAKAAQHKPCRWTLIVPIEMSPSERTWFDPLRSQYQSIELVWLGREWLDGQFAQHEDLRRMVEGPDYQLLVRAKELGLEQSVLAGGLSDIADRYRTLQSRVDEVSPYWTFRPTTDGLLVLQEARPGAAEMDPITLTTRLAFPADDPDASRTADLFRRAIEHGEQVVVPSKYIAGIDIDASEETQRLFGQPEEWQGDLHLLPAREQLAPPVPGVLERRSSSGSAVGSCPVSFTSRVGGTVSATVTGADFGGLVQISVTLKPLNDGFEFSVKFDVSAIAGHIPYAIVPTLKVLGELEPGDQLVLLVGDVELTSNPFEPSEIFEHAQRALRLSEDLLQLQKANGVTFAIPTELTDEELWDVTEMAAALRGERPRRRSSVMNMTIRPGALPEAVSHLQQDGQLRVRTRSYDCEVAGYVLTIGGAQLDGPKMRLDDREALAAAGVNQEEVVISMRPFDGEGVYLDLWSGEEDQTSRTE